MSRTEPLRPADRACVIVAAGRSTRFRSAAANRGAAGEVRKPLVELEGRSLLEHACAPFVAHERVRELVLVVHAEDRERVEALVAARPALSKVRAILPGGRERADSVRIGVEALGPDLELVAVHDAARPLVSPALVESVFEAAGRSGAALAAVALSDTVKESSDGRRVERTLERSRLWAAQTPQAFALARFREVLAQALRDELRPTDDAALWERYVGPVTIVEGESTNLKVTSAQDLELARGILAQRSAPRAAVRTRGSTGS